MNDLTFRVPKGGFESDFAEIDRRFWAMHESTRSEPPSSETERRRLLKALRGMVSGSSREFVEAISRDFGHRSPDETRTAEVLPTLMAVRGALSKLRAWMRPEKRPGSILFFPGRNTVHHQPKGVVLIVSPWNYPLLLTVGPLAAALAAGNRVIIKPSEATPATSALLKQRLEVELGADRVFVATGDAKLSEHLCGLPFDHILFTGSTAVGRKVMAAAAPNLTPVTLELGGKSPAIVHRDYDLRLAASRIARGKLLNAGQTCIAPDYALVPRDKVEAFTLAYRDAAAEYYPRLLDNPDYTAIAADRHFDRLQHLVEDACQKGARMHVVDPASEMSGAQGDRASRKMAPVVLTEINDAMVIAREEVFGPLLPIIAYDQLEDAIAYVNGRPRPLALYYFDTSASRTREVLERTVSGGATVNDTIYHIAQDDLPFGGVGASGMGSYHGDEGFRTFSHSKGTFRQARFASTDLLSPPYDGWYRAIIRFAMRLQGG